MTVLAASPLLVALFAVIVHRLGATSNTRTDHTLVAVSLACAATLSAGMALLLPMALALAIWAGSAAAFASAMRYLRTTSTPRAQVTP